VLAATGETEAARAMYERAIADIIESGGNAAYLEMKRDALRADAPVATSGKP
jgi:predicted negative regulator of RcsB-dependent stress response